MGLNVEHEPGDAATAALELTVTSAGEVSSARATIREWLRSRIASKPTDEVILAVGEAVDNALEHGQPPISIVMEWSAGSMLETQIRDAGEWTVPTDSSSRGFGLPIIRKLMDEFTVQNNNGTVVTLSRRFDR